MLETRRSFTWRKTTVADLASCLEVQPAHLGGELTGPEIARKVWREILPHPAMVTAVFECDPPTEGRRIVGFGAAVFVSEEFTERELANPRPYITARVIESVHAGRPVLLTAGEIAQANAATGLDLTTLYASGMESALSTEEIAEVRALLGISLAQLIVGYRVRRIFGEATNGEIQSMRASGLVREIAAFPELNRVINIAARPDTVAVPFSLARTMFNHREPFLRLSGGDQQLIWAALEGQTDVELAASLRLTLPAVKARWRSVFAKFAKMESPLAPEFFGQGGRGPQKRHRVLAYAREHPEELRPFTADC